MTGVADFDIKILINNAVQLLRTAMVAKVHMNSVKPRGRPKKDVGISAAIEADRFAMTSLEEVAKSNAISMNCVISPQQANLTWHLYISLVYLVTPPQQMMPSAHRPQPSGMPPQGATNMLATHMHPPHLGQAPPPGGHAPHQFLLREQPNMHGGPAANQVMFDRVKMYTPGYVPRGGPRMNLLERSGQTLNLMFQEPVQQQPTAMNMPFGHPIVPPPGMTLSPAMQNAMGRPRTMSATPINTNGTAPPQTLGAVVQDR